MLISLILLITLIANTWLSWMLGGIQGITLFLIAIPIVFILMIGGALALGLINMLFSSSVDIPKSRKFMRGFFHGWAGLVSGVFLLPWVLFGIVYLTNIYTPATLPRTTITNGEKTVVFQSMMHIASPGFYDEIEADMRELSTHEYIFFYEGVRSDSPESLEKLSKLMGTQV